MKRGIQSPMGKDKWHQNTVLSILKSEKMKGDALLQKTYIEDFLTKKQVKNRGGIPQYYVTGNHEAIIDPETFDLVQAEIARRKTERRKYSGVSIFSNRIKCGECGAWFGSKVWHSNDKYRRVIWQCNHKFAGKKCSTPHFTEDEIKEMFVKAFNRLFESRTEIIENIKAVKEAICNTATLEAERDRLANEMKVLSEIAKNAIRENAMIAQDQTEYQKRYDDVVKRYENAKTAYEETVRKIEAQTVKASMLTSFSRELRKQESVLEEFDEGLWGTLVDFMTVHSRKDIEVTFKDGTTIGIQ